MNKTTQAKLWQAMPGLLSNWRTAEWLRCSHQGGEEHGCRRRSRWGQTCRTFLATLMLLFFSKETWYHFEVNFIRRECSASVLYFDKIIFAAVWLWLGRKLEEMKEMPDDFEHYRLAKWVMRSLKRGQSDANSLKLFSKQYDT